MSERPFGDHQGEIYARGAAGEAPVVPIRQADLQARAREVLDPGAYDYVAGGAGSESTARDNVEAFARWRIVPRHLRDVSRRDLEVELFGRRLPAPVALAPVGVLGIIHADAELAVARAAAALGLPMTLSTVASRPLEEVAGVMGDAPRWFQLYWPNVDAITRSLLGRAEASGFEAIVLTIDTKLLGWRERDLQNAFLPFFHGEGLANYLSDPAFMAELGPSPGDDAEAAIGRWSELLADLSQTWDDLAALREMTPLPIVLKGILHPDDARLAVDAGVDGIVVSNHGGRQLDGAIPALEALPGVVDAIAGRVPVLFDSGVRGGADIFKGLALGATTVLVGRPWVWGLAAAGEAGVREVMLRLLAELDLTMALSGCARLADITRESVSPAP